LVSKQYTPKSKLEFNLPDRSSFLATYAGDMSAQRNTRQRETILGVIQHASGPLGVMEILERSRTQIPGLGLATVYRTLALLKSGAQVIEVNLPGEESRFEAGERHHHHHHFVCQNCHKVFELETCPVGIPTGSVLPGGFRVADHHLTLYGSCPQCDVRIAA
jgi:Fur family transcriptional regulator, ferric uptake regulator